MTLSRHKQAKKLSKQIIGSKTPRRKKATVASEGGQVGNAWSKDTAGDAGNWSCCRRCKNCRLSICELSNRKLGNWTHRRRELWDWRLRRLKKGGLAPGTQQQCQWIEGFGNIWTRQHWGCPQLTVHKENPKKKTLTKWKTKTMGLSQASKQTSWYWTGFKYIDTQVGHVKAITKAERE